MGPGGGCLEQEGELRELEREMGTTSESRAGGELPHGRRQALRSRLGAAAGSVQLWGRLKQSWEGCPPDPRLRKRGGGRMGESVCPPHACKGQIASRKCPAQSMAPGAGGPPLQSGCGAPQAEEQGPGGTHVPSSGAARTRCSSACCRKAFSGSCMKPAASSGHASPHSGRQGGMQSPSISPTLEAPPTQFSRANLTWQRLFQLETS